VELYPPHTPAPGRQLLAVHDLDRAGVERILDAAHGFESVMERDVKKVPTLRGRTVASVFFESSTRTSASFELAAKRLSADTITIRAAGSSVDKGESLADTVRTLSAYGPDVLVIRHPHVGAAAVAARHTGAHVVNAGDGTHQHPTQCLLDLYTIRTLLGRVEGVHVAIVGDVLHSRVARSNIEGLRLLGARVSVVAPPSLLPRDVTTLGVDVSHRIESIRDADVVYVLRMQRERMLEGANHVPSLREYAARWGVTADRVRPTQLVMHPGPMNRGVEIAPEVADASNSAVERQVRAGLVVRMAVLYDLLTDPTPRGAPARSRQEVA
jgi:aspartate carbamoyltransferase catalytic subunit